PDRGGGGGCPAAATLGPARRSLRPGRAGQPAGAAHRQGRRTQPGVGADDARRVRRRPQQGRPGTGLAAAPGGGVDTCGRTILGRDAQAGSGARSFQAQLILNRLGSMERVQVALEGPPQTMLATLYAKALDAEFPDPILGEPYAKEAVVRIDYAWKHTTITARNAASVTTRTAHLDTWARQFLAAHTKAQVLHVGCGLDGR